MYKTFYNGHYKDDFSGYVLINFDSEKYVKFKSKEEAFKRLEKEKTKLKGCFGFANAIPRVMTIIEIYL